MATVNNPNAENELEEEEGEKDLEEEDESYASDEELYYGYACSM